VNEPDLPEEAELDEQPDDPAVVPAREKNSTLSVVATPIGNLEDITLRALRTLREADLVLAEDTRRTRVLCQHHGIHSTLRAYHAHSSPQALENILTELGSGKHVALVSDAGTPLLSDPGAALVSAAQARGFAVETIPGPSAVIAALTVSGLAVDHFTFLGFLPRSGRRRREALANLASSRVATVVFESPRRLADTLMDLAEQLEPERQIAVCRELTKLHEQVHRGTAGELAEQFAEGARGEITLVIAGRTAPDEAPTDDDLDERIAQLRATGLSARDTAAQLARETGVRKQLIYARVTAKTKPSET
jgi:16S rRNA (cytidine1402-2'-O)-methyltransferase